MQIFIKISAAVHELLRKQKQKNKKTDNSENNTAIVSTGS